MMKLKAGTKLYSFQETYRITFLAFRSVKGAYYAKKHELLSDALMERIMLAVTEVNACEICVLKGTQMALEAGLSSVEIQSLLDGFNSHVPEDELPAIMFAQHYADYRGRPSRKSWQRIVRIYGLPKARGILGVVRMIMLGNTYGIAWSSFFHRFKGRSDLRSNLLYELGMILSTFIFVPTAFIHNLIRKLSRPA